MLNFFRNFQNLCNATSAGSIAPSGAIRTLPSTPVAAGVDPLSCVITRLDQEHALELVSQQRSSNNRLTLDVSILSVTSITSTSMPTANAGMLGVGVLRGGAAVYYIWTSFVPLLTSTPVAPCPAAPIDPASLSLIVKDIVGVSKDSLKALEDYHLVIGKASYLTEAATHHLKEAKRGLDEANFRAQWAKLDMESLEKTHSYLSWLPYPINEQISIHRNNLLLKIAASERRYQQFEKERVRAVAKFWEAESEFYMAEGKARHIINNAKETAENAIKKTSDAVIDVTERLGDVAPQVVEHSSGFGQVTLFLGVTLVLSVGAFYVGRWSSLKKI